MTSAQLYKYVNDFLATLDKFEITTYNTKKQVYILETYELVDYWIDKRGKYHDK